MENMNDMTVRAKFTVMKSSEFGYAGPNGPVKNMMYAKDSNTPTEHPFREITMSAVYGGSPENESFAAATPSGTITFQLSNPAVADEFKPGQTYYVDFTPAEK